MMSTGTMAAIPRPDLYLSPLEAEEGSSEGENVVGGALSEVIALALSGRGFPISMSERRPGGVVIRGRYALGRRLSLQLLAMRTDDESVIAEGMFESDEPLGDLFDTIIIWARPLGRGEGRADGPVPTSLSDLRLAVKMIAFLHTALLAPSILSTAFQSELQAITVQILPRVRDVAMARLTREWIVRLAPLMMARRRPTGETGGALLLASLADDLAPVGEECIRKILAAGLAAGEDRPAFLACLAAFEHSLMRDEAALAELSELRALAPLDGLYWTATCALGAGRYRDAAIAADSALRIAPEGPFRDLIRGSGAEPDDLAESWRAILLFLEGAALLHEERYADAERTLLEARSLHRDKFEVLEYLAHVYRNWGMKEISAGREAIGTALYREHVDVLDALYAIRPRIQEVHAALSVMSYLANLELKRRWKAREMALEAGATRTPARKSH